MGLADRLRSWLRDARPEAGVRECTACGATLEAAESHCPNCGGARHEAPDHVPVYWELD